MANSPARVLLDDVTEDASAVETTRIAAVIRSVHPSELPILFQSIETLLSDDPERGDDVVDVILPELDATDEETRVAAARALAIAASSAPNAVVPFLDAVTELMEDDVASIRGAAVRILVVMAQHRPDEALERLDALVDRMRDDNRYVGEITIDFVHTMLPEHSPALVAFVPALVETLETPPETTPRERRTWFQHHPHYAEFLDRQRVAVPDQERYLAAVARLLSAIASHQPTAVADHISSIAAILERERSRLVRNHLLDAIGAVAEAEPDAVEPAIDAVAAVLADGRTDSLLAHAAWTLAWLAEDHSQAVTTAVSDQLPSLITAIESDDEELGGAIVALLSYVAEHRPAEVEPVLPHVRERIESEETQHRGLAVWVLAYAGDETDLDRLERLATEDPAAEVRSAASEGHELLGDRIREA